MSAKSNNPSKIDKLFFRLKANSPSFKQRAGRLYRVLRDLDPSRCYVSFSAGKESTVIAHAAHTVHPGIPICMVDPGTPWHWTEAERDMWLGYADRNGWNLQLFPWDKWGVSGIAEAKDAKQHAKAAHDSMFQDIHAWSELEGRDHVIMGLRAEESKGRRMSLATHGERHTYKDGRTRVAPLGLWSTDEIWSYIVVNDLPWLTIYDHLGPEARNGIIGRNGIEHGRIAYVRKYYPEAYRAARDVLGLAYVRDNS